jgi:hypothetical protein
MAPILGPDGRPLKRRGWYDAEALALEDGVAYVGIERVNQVVRFDYAKDGLRARGSPIAVPPGVKTLAAQPEHRMPGDGAKGGPLAGTLIALLERGLDTGGNLMGFLIGGRISGSGGTFLAQAHRRLRRQRLRGTPDGNLLVLERRFSWTRGLAVRIRSVPLAAIKPGRWSTAAN